MPEGRDCSQCRSRRVAIQHRHIRSQEPASNPANPAGDNASRFRRWICGLAQPRIGWGASVEIDRAQWAPDARFDIATRQERESQFVRRFNNYPLEVLRDYGERLSAAHALSSLPQNLHLAQAASLSGITLDRYLWREGLMAEEKAPRVEASVKVFQQKVRNMLADWVDFDVAAAHYAYGFDILCSQESGRSSTSIFSSARSQTLTTDFNIYVLNIVGLTKLCLRRYWFSLTRWD
jgi:hypothetical protein